jgi:cytochrome b561
MWMFTGVLFSGIICLFLQRSLPTVTTLHSLTGDRRHAARQRRTQTLLNAWLFLHVPLAYAMLALVVIHAVMSLRYAALR